MSLAGLGSGCSIYILDLAKEVAPQLGLPSCDLRSAEVGLARAGWPAASGGLAVGDAPELLASAPLHTLVRRPGRTMRKARA